MPERGFGAQAFALEASTAQTGHFRGRSGLVEEDEPVWREPHPGLPFSLPFLARLANVGPIAFAGQQRFFKAIAVADEPTRQGGRVGPRAAFRFERARQFRHRDVVLFRQALQKKHTVRIELGVSPTPDRPGRQAAARPVRGHQVDDERRRNIEMHRGGAPGMARLHIADNTLTNIRRIRSRHCKSPPCGNESQTEPPRTPYRFNLMVRRSRGHSRHPNCGPLPIE